MHSCICIYVYIYIINYVISMPLDILFIFMYNSKDRSLLHLFETCIKELGATCRGKLEPGMPQ